MYIAIDGVIGVGKTSLARLLQPAFSAEVLLEVFEENPFLSDFYSDRARYAFQTQMFFLLSRYHQQHRAVPEALERGSLIADYTFAKDALFARLNLNGHELELYHRLHDALAERLVTPDLLVYLRAPTELLLRRIAQRGRAYEQNMDANYIAQLVEAYDEFFSAPQAAPVLVLEAAQYDFVARPDDLESIARRLREALNIGDYQTSLPLEP